MPGGKTAEFYAREALKREPELKQNHNNLRRAQEGTVPDWNFANHSRRIAYYQQFVCDHPTYAGGYLWLLDELLADGRLDEAQTVCDALQQQDNSCRAAFYQAGSAGSEVTGKQHRRSGTGCWRSTVKTGWPLPVWRMPWPPPCHYDEALRYARKAQQLQPAPKYTDSQVMAAQIHEIRGDYGQAIEIRREQLALLEQEWGPYRGAGRGFYYPGD